ncbi:MAG: AI-2E family transporter [Gammaproteobacteria bacterium]|nr:AI-2E family transporter [Gammaproteobacteria bacterium]
MGLTEMSSGMKFLVASACLIVILAGLKLAAVIVTPLLLAVFIATLVAAPVGWLVTKRVPAPLAISLTLIVLILLVITLGAIVVESAQQLYAKQPEYVAKLNSMLESWEPTLIQLGLPTAIKLEEILNAATIWSLASQTLTGVGNLISNSFLILLVFVLILIESSALTKKMRNLLSATESDRTWLDAFATNIHHYIVIKTIHSLGTGLLIALGTWLLGVDFPILWGLLAFILNYIPNIGSIIAALPAVLVAVVQLGMGTALGVIVLFVGINVLIGSFIEPRFMGERLGLSTLVVFLSLVFWGYMFGTVGMLLSVPITMTIKIAAEANPSTRWLSDLLGNTVTDDEIEPE